MHGYENRPLSRTRRDNTWRLLKRACEHGGQRQGQERCEIEKEKGFRRAHVENLLCSARVLFVWELRKQSRGDEGRLVSIGNSGGEETIGRMMPILAPMKRRHGTGTGSMTADIPMSVEQTTHLFRIHHLGLATDLDEDTQNILRQCHCVQTSCCGQSWLGLGRGRQV